MKTPSEHTLSLWADDRLEFSAEMLRDDTTADVCVIGGGIAGLTTAYLLGRENLHVVLIDADAPVSGETSRTTAHLANAIDDRFTNLQRWHGEEGSRLAAQSHMAAIDLIERIASEEMIACDFRRLDGYLFSATGDLGELEKEFEAAKRAGVDVSLIDPPAGVNLGSTKCLRFPRQGQFNPLRYLEGLVAAIVSQEGRIFSQTRAVEIEEGDEVVITTSTGRKVRAGAVVVATNSPFNNRVALHTKMHPYRTYVIAGRIPAGSLPAGLYWDTLDPYHYVRLASSSHGELDTLIIGGEDHRTGQEANTREHLTKLENWARARFPQIQEVTHRWSGQVMETTDGVAFIGRNPGSRENCFVVTGDSGMGMTHGTIAGMLITDLVQKRENPWAKLYDPSRVTVAAAGTYVEENLNMAKQYLDWAVPEDHNDLSNLVPNTGRVIQRGLHKIAVFRAPDGTIHEMSAVCTHLGCVVRWNDTERAWDCPCHGSRFEATGEVINGPATAPLTPVSSLSKS